MQSSCWAIAITMDMASNNHMPKLLSGTNALVIQKRGNAECFLTSRNLPNKEMWRHSTSLVFATKMLMVLNCHTRRQQSGTEKQRNKDIKMPGTALAIAIAMALALKSHIQKR